MHLRRLSGTGGPSSDAAWMARGGPVRKSKKNLRTTEISQEDVCIRCLHLVKQMIIEKVSHDLQCCIMFYLNINWVVLLLPSRLIHRKGAADPMNFVKTGDVTGQ